MDDLRLKFFSMASYVISDDGIRITKGTPSSELSSFSDDLEATRSLSLETPGRPKPQHHASLPTYSSPMRHHRRAASKANIVKETPNARSSYKSSQDDGKWQRHINQYIIGEEIGRGSFGAVHLAVDQWGSEFAVKEFSKSRLRKRARSQFLRQPPHVRRAGQLQPGGRGSPRPTFSGDDDEPESSLHLIQEEIAVMKKLNHPNLVQLIEVLDDPDEDSLFMVLELCKKGVVMKVGLGERAEPYDHEQCRHWFRDLILGIEYLHAQGIAHRDIKPDNLLLTDTDILKVVDFGVSEIFEKESDMATAKSAGSPAYLPPELCVARHGNVSSQAADIWSMGVSLYCLRYGHVPFEQSGVLELYEAIRKDEVKYDGVDVDPNFIDMMNKLLEKNPAARITMDELREHPWVTRDGEDRLMSTKENVSVPVEPPTPIEVNHAITHNIGNLVFIMKVCNKFKRLLLKKHPEKAHSLFGDSSRFVQPPGQMHEEDFESKHGLKKGYSLRRSALKRSPPSAGETVGPKSEPTSKQASFSIQPPSPVQKHEEPQPSRTHARSPSPAKGQAQNPLEVEAPWLHIGSGEESTTGDNESIAESPAAADFSIYETAYEQEVARIRQERGEAVKVYTTRRVASKAEHEDKS